MSFTVFHGTKEKTQMKFSYNKLWKLLIDKGWTKTKFRQEAGISSATIAKLGKGETSLPIFYLKFVLHLIVRLKKLWKAYHILNKDFTTDIKITLK